MTLTNCGLMKTLVLFKQTCLAEKGRSEENNVDCTIAHEFSESICLCSMCFNALLSQLRDLALGSDTKNHGQRLMDLHVH